MQVHLVVDVVTTATPAAVHVVDATQNLDV